MLLLFLCFTFVSAQYAVANLADVQVANLADVDYIFDEPVNTTTPEEPAPPDEPEEPSFIQTNCTIGTNDHCNDVASAYAGQNDTDCDCVPDSCDSAPEDSQIGSLSDCETDTSQQDDDGTSDRLAFISVSVVVLLLGILFRNICTCCESGEETTERLHKNDADMKKISELKSERETLLKNTNKLEQGTIPLRF